MQALAERRGGQNDPPQDESDRLLAVIGDLRQQSIDIRLDALLRESGLSFSEAARLLGRLRRRRLIHSLPSHAIMLTPRGRERSLAQL